MLISTLQQIGLEEKEARIYLANLELGKTSIKEIAKKSGIKRTTIYDIIDEMVNLGYIKTTVEGKRKRFVAVGPSELKAIIRKKEALLDEIMPELKDLSNLKGKKPKIWYFEGVDGLREAYEDTLKNKEKIIYQWASDDMLDVLGNDWALDYIKKRVRKKIFAQCIAINSEKIRGYKKQDKKQLRKTKTINPKNYPFNIELDLYGDRAAFISPKDKIAVILESPFIANTMKAIFQLSWESLGMNDVDVKEVKKTKEEEELEKSDYWD